MKHIKKILPFLFAALLMVACGPKDQQATGSEAETKDAADEANDEKFETNKAEADADFVVEAVNSNYAEIEMAQLAGQRSDNAEIKEIAKLLENEHNQLLKDLQTLAGKKAITIPTEKDDADRRSIDALNEKSDIRDFNKTWCKEMVDAHEKSIEKFEERLQKTEDPDVKALVNKALPHLRTHLEKVKACEQKIAEAKK
jgi:putative membrane protein